MIKYIREDAAIEAVCGGCNEQFDDEPCEPSCCSIRERLKAIPAADVRPVVLCKDCVYLTHDEYGAWCFNNYEANLKDDDFCSCGKRKEKQT